MLSQRESKSEIIESHFLANIHLPLRPNRSYIVNRGVSLRHFVRFSNKSICVFPIPEYISQRDTVCAPNLCKCSNGVGKTACDCPIEAINDCQTCNLGYHLEVNLKGDQNTCVENKCSCTGIALLLCESNQKNH